MYIGDGGVPYQERPCVSALGGSLGGSPSNAGGEYPPSISLRNSLRKKVPNFFFHAGGISFGYKNRIPKSWGV